MRSAVGRVGRNRPGARHIRSVASAINACRLLTERATVSPHLQGNGRSQVYGVTVGKGNNVFAAGYTYGNMTFTGIHASDGVFGEQTDHTAIGPPDHTDTTSIFHNSKTILGGRYTDEANSQHGSDGIIYKMNEDGDPAAIYAVDIMPADGKLEDSINGGWGGWAYFYNIKQVGSTKDLIAIGNFRGNLTVPIGSDSSTVLHNPKNGQTDGFVVKLDGDNMQAAWAKAPGQFADGRNYFRNLAMDSADNAIITSEVRPSKKCTRARGARRYARARLSPCPAAF